MRIMTQSGFALSACIIGMTARADVDMQEFLQQVSAAYTLTSTIEYEMETFMLDGPNQPVSDEINGLISGRTPINPRLIKVHQDGSVLNDLTHPSQRAFVTRPFGTVSAYGVTVQIVDSETLKGRSWSELLFASSRVSLNPGAVADLIKCIARVDLASNLTKIEDGWRFEGAGHVIILEPDYVLREMTVSSPGGRVSHKRVLRCATSPALRARFPSAIWSGIYENGDKLIASNLHILSIPRLSTGNDESIFRWWTYAGEMLDERTGTLYGPGNVEIDPAKVEPVGLAANPADLAMFVDERSLEAHAKDPSALVLPRRKWTPQPYLLVGGITLIVLGLAWALRRRFAA